MTKTSISALQIKAKLFCGFSDRSRLAIMETLRGGRRSVGDIATRTGLTQPNVSNHLKCLSECGLVSREADGRFVRYGLADRRVARLLRLADELLVDCAERISDCENYRPQTSNSPSRACEPADRAAARHIRRKAA